MRDYVSRVQAAEGDLIILGNGSPQQAAWFVEDYHVETPVYTDSALVAHGVLGARRPFVIDPRTFLRSLDAMRRGFRQTGVKGSAVQLGGVFVITPDGRMPYRYLSRFAGDHPDPEQAVSTLERWRERDEPAG